jgi:hypothetical protein
MDHEFFLRFSFRFTLKIWNVRDAEADYSFIYVLINALIVVQSIYGNIFTRPCGAEFPNVVLKLQKFCNQVEGGRVWKYSIFEKNLKKKWNDFTIPYWL